MWKRYKEDFKSKHLNVDNSAGGKCREERSFHKGKGELVRDFEGGIRCSEGGKLTFSGGLERGKGGA